MRPGHRGFTLLELLVAMAVLALLGALSFRGLGSVLDAQARLQAESRRWNEVALLAAQLSQDVAATFERTVRDETDRLRPALVLSTPLNAGASTELAQLSLTRLGYGEPGSAPGTPRRVGYRLREGIVEYLLWPAADAAPGTIPIAEAVLEDVAELQFQALDDNGTWSSAWPGGRAPGALPRAISMQIVLAGGESITRVFSLR